MYDDSVTKIENALAYAALGWAVFPCHTREADGNCSCGNRPCFDTAKHPLTENGVKSAAKDAGTLAKFFTGDYAVANIAVATGEPSGVWVIDVDDLAALAKLEYQYGRLPKTAIAETGRCGRHYFFRWTEALANLKNSVKFAGELDVRTTGGYILLPPSVHATGKAYRWLVSPDETPIVDAPDWLIDIVPKRETLTVNAVCVEERIAKYLAACPAAISGQSGHATTFGVICRVVETFPEVRGKDDEELLSLLKTWNERCVPPWTDRELLHKIGDAQRKAVTATPTPISPASIITSTSSVPVDNVDPPEEWPTLDADARHGIAGELLGTLEPHTEADSAGLLLTFLVAFGSIVGRNAYVYAGGDCHHANLYATLVGASSRARKGTSLGYILSVFAGLDTEWSGRRVNGLSSGEGVVAAVQDGYDDDGTLLTDDKRLLVIETEFGTTLRVLKREQNTLSGALRNAWDRGELGVLTRTAPLRASNAHISILGHITRNELIRYLSDVDVFNGFANRFLWVLVQRSKMLPEASPPTLDDLRRRLTMVCQTAKKIAEVKRSASASVIWCKSYPALVAEKRGLWDAVTSRAEAQVLRLSLIYALLDGSDTIDVPHLRAALAIWRYCDESARLIFTPDGGDGEGGTLEARIRQIVRERPGIMRTELRDTISHKIKAAELEGALTWLAGRGEIERRTSTENGRVCERVHPTDVKKQIVSAAMTVKSVLPPPTPSVDDLVAAIVVAPAAPDAPLPQRPAAPEINVEGDKGTKALTETEFFAEIPQTPPAIARAATLTELLDWRNVNAASFTRRADGVVWVTNEDRLTPTIRAAIDANQDTLASLVPVEQHGKRNGDRSACDIPLNPSKEEMRERYRKCLADVIPAKYENGVIVNWDEMNAIYRKDDPPLTDEFRALFELPKKTTTDNEAEFLALLNSIGEA